MQQINIYHSKAPPGREQEFYWGHLETIQLESLPRTAEVQFSPSNRNSRPSRNPSLDESDKFAFGLE